MLTLRRKVDAPMHRYFIKTPAILRWLFPNSLWCIQTQERKVFLTFDDGPHPVITPWVLDELRKYNAKATFFCVGKNVVDFPEVYDRILAEGHATGNHTFNHLNGWQTNNKEYAADISKASSVIHSRLFRPPYGKIKPLQHKRIPAAMNDANAKVIMWDVLSADFDNTLSPQQCVSNVIDHYTSGSIIVFHDSEKAFPRLEIVLPKVLKELKDKNYECCSLEALTTTNN
jgi:peptidoglycan/xylan/chitin deacetylase (PgdA/CDA1 family)